MAESAYISWGTKSEIRFIANLGKLTNLGKWNGGYPQNRPPRAILLEQYIAAAHNRERWQHIDKDDVMAYANQ